VSGVLVTGAAGFIGLPVVRGLARRGVEVHALSTRSATPEIPGVRWHRVDLTEPRALEHVIAGIEPRELVHLAWYTNHGEFWHRVENLVWVERSLCLLRAFVGAGGQRIVMLGSCAEYDWSGAGAPLDEHRSRLAPATLYGVSKDALRRVARAYAEQEGVEFAWGRPFFLYGPREAPGRLVPSTIRSLLAGTAIATRSGDQVRDYMYVEDVAGAVVALLESDVVGEVNIASGIGVRMGEVFDRVARLIGRPELIQRGALAEHTWEPSLLVADVHRLSDEVGYRPRWSLDQGLAASVRWWEQQEDSSTRSASNPAAVSDNLA
jgi:nucleoside-diphosphate-sugar epimerase